MKRYVLLSLMVANVVHADVPANQLHEVNYLMNFIKNSDCIINRNGTDHSPEKGVIHIKKKYKYFKEKIKSTEDFIEYSATKSTMSGAYYTVTCSGEETVKTKDWLLVELQKYRSR